MDKEKTINDNSEFVNEQIQVNQKQRIQPPISINSNVNLAMQEVVFFSLHREFKSEHSDIGGNWHYVGSANVQHIGDADDLPEVEITRLYMAADPQKNCLPSVYLEADPENLEFKKSKAFEEIEDQCIELFALELRPKYSADAQSICNHFAEREKVAKAQGFIISVAEIHANKNRRVSATNDITKAEYSRLIKNLYK